MDTGVIAIRERENSRYNLLKSVISGMVTLADAADAMGVSYRQAKRLKRSVVEEGLRGVVHGNRGRAPSNKLDEELRRRVLELSVEKYGGFNDTHFTEMLAQREEIELSRESVRSLRREAGMKPKQKRRPKKHHKRRPRKSAEGMMMLWDGSPHRWFGREYEPCCLMAAIDDATGKVLALRFVEFEGSYGYLSLLMTVVSRYGIPASVYQDKHGSLRRNDGRWTIDEELAGRQEPTQVGKALESLGIEAIFALSPQAKGRVERLFRTLQDRLVPMLEFEGIRDIGKANDYIDGIFLNEFNARFSTQAEEKASVWRKPGKGLDVERIVSFSYEASIGHDNSIRFGGMVIDVKPGPAGRGYAGVRAEVRQMLDGSWRVYYQDKLIAVADATDVSEPIRALQRRKGIRANTHSSWVYRASEPAVADKPSGNSIKRAGPGGVIGATRIA